MILVVIPARRIASGRDVAGPLALRLPPCSYHPTRLCEANARMTADHRP